VRVSIAAHDVVFERACGEHQDALGAAVLAQLARERRAVAVGQHQVEHHQIVARQLERTTRLDERLGGGDGIRDGLVLEVVDQHEPQVLVVLDDQDARLAHGLTTVLGRRSASDAWYSNERGNRSVKVVPLELEATVMLPPWSAITILQIDRPSPVPRTPWTCRAGSPRTRSAVRACRGRGRRR